MSELNRAASDAMMQVGVHACADITGFGLLGHLRLIAQGSRVNARITAAAIPVIHGVPDLLAQGIAPGGTHRNLESLADLVHWRPDIPDQTRILLADAQTSGGLLIAVPPAKLDALLTALTHAGVQTRAVIGELTPQDSLPALIQVDP